MVELELLIGLGLEAVISRLEARARTRHGGTTAAQDSRSTVINPLNEWSLPQCGGG
jgi:hypothetical protein